MTHIATVETKKDDWQKLSDIITAYKGTAFAFDTNKTYRIQNVGINKVVFVESASDLEDTQYEEGEVITPYQYYKDYNPSTEPLYVRCGGIGRLTITEISSSKTEANIAQINNKIGDINTELEQI